MISSERLYWNASKTKLVKEGDSEAAFLFCPAGQTIQKCHHSLVEAVGASKKEAKQEGNKEDVSGKNKSKKTTKFGGGK